MKFIMFIAVFMITGGLFAENANANTHCFAYCLSVEEAEGTYKPGAVLKPEQIFKLQSKRIVSGFTGRTDPKSSYNEALNECISLVKKETPENKNIDVILVQISQTTGKIVGATPSTCINNY